MTAYRLLQEFAIAINVICLVVPLLFRSYSKIPILLNPQRSILVHFKPVPRHQLANSSVERFRTGEISEGQILWQGSAVKLRTYARVCQNRFDFRTEQKNVRSNTIIQRLDSQSVSRYK